MYRTTLIVTAPTTTLLTTVDAIGAELNFVDVARRERAGLLIQQASDMIVDYCGSPFARATVTDKFNFNNDYEYGHNSAQNFSATPLILSRSPVAAVVEVADLGSILDVSLYEVDYDNGLFYGRRGGYSVSVTYDGGYLLPGQLGRNLPASVERACIDTVSAMWFRTKRGDPMLRSESVDGIGASSYMSPGAGPSGSLPPMAVAALYPFRNIRV